MNFAALSLNLREFSRSDLLPTVVVGLLIVFSVLAIIYFCLVIMERIFRAQSDKQPNAVVAPFKGTILSVCPDSTVSANSVVAVIQDSTGAEFELMSPVPGTLKLNIQNGDAVRKDSTLFWVE